MENEGVGNEEIDRFMGWTTVDLRGERLGRPKPVGGEARAARGPAERGNVGRGTKAKRRQREDKYADQGGDPDQ